MVELNQLSPPRGSRKKPQRPGRGLGARKSRPAGRGKKGRRSRTGRRRRPGFGGGQMPLHRRLPKRGFTNIFRSEHEVVNVAELNVFAAGARVTPEELRARGLLRRPLPVKILGDGDLTVKLTVVAHAFSAGAKEKIEKAGGKVEVLGPAAPPAPAPASGEQPRA